jgi:hypothetical protein
VRLQGRVVRLQRWQTRILRERNRLERSRNRGWNLLNILRRRGITYDGLSRRSIDST